VTLRRRRLFWLLLLWACRSSSQPVAVPPAAARPTVSDLLPSSHRKPGGAWYGLYLGGRKVGFGRFQLRPGAFEGRPALESHLRMEMTATFGPMPVELRIEGSRWYEAAGAQRLLAVVRRQEQGPLVTEIDVRRRGDKMVAIRRTQGREERREIPASRETAKDDLVVGGASLKPGQVRQGHSFVEDLLQDFAITVRVLSSGQEFVGGLRLPLLRARVEGLPMGLGAEALLSSEGDLVLSKVGPLTMRLEGESVARAPWARSDLVSISPRVDRLRDRRQGVVRLRVHGLPHALARDDARQKFERQADGSYRVTLRRLVAPTKPPPTLPITGSGFAKELEPTPVLQSDHPEIRAAAREAVGSERDSFRAALQLREWVHRRIRPTWKRTLDALTALRAGGGMCYELAHVLAAMARAAGIPARLAYGLVYAETAAGGVFGGHAWTELWVGEWIPFDATEREGPAVGPHFKLGTHDAAGDALEALGSIRTAWE
jgi:hypothetical protein